MRYQLMLRVIVLPATGIVEIGEMFPGTLGEREKFVGDLSG